MREVEAEMPTIDPDRPAARGGAGEGWNNTIGMVLLVAIHIREADGCRRETILLRLNDEPLSRDLRPAIGVERPQLCALAHRKALLLAIHLATAGVEEPRLAQSAEAEVEKTFG